MFFKGLKLREKIQPIVLKGNIVYNEFEEGGIITPIDNQIELISAFIGIPEIIFQARWLRLTRVPRCFVLFPLLMILSAIGMLKTQEMKWPKLPRDQALITLGISVGLISARQTE